MRFSYLPCIIALFSLLSCFPSAPTETIEEEVDELKNTQWQLADNYDLDATISFGEDINELNGNDGCNDFTCDIVQHNYHIELTNFVTTKNICSELDGADRDFIVALSKVVDYRFTSKKLILNTYGTTVNVGDRRVQSIVFKRIEN